MNKSFISPLLTISIPTWNRASYLALTLNRLSKELKTVAARDVEVIVSDNCSNDSTENVVKSVQMAGLPVRYVRNPENLGSDYNIAQCFNLAKGKYVLILSDDDLIFDNSLSVLLAHLKTFNYGVVCLRAFGYENDYLKEYPGGHGQSREY
jgi:glycosyltransferase involved in cell wall biosynthesis